MNENSGETPNPLNPTPVNGTNNEETTTPTTATENAQADTLVEEPAANVVAEGNTTSTAADSAEPGAVGPATKQVESLDPTGRSMEATAEVPQLPKKSKAGMIIGVIIACVLLIGGVVAAIMMSAGKGDAVSAAMQKIMSGDAPSKVAIDGDINILLNDETSPIKRVNVNLDSDIMVGSMINTSSAVVTLTDANNKDYSFKFEEIYATENNLFFKIEGAADAIQQSGLLNLTTNSNLQANCITDETGSTNCVSSPVVQVDCSNETDCVETGGEIITQNAGMDSQLADAIISIIEAVDGVYLKISSEDMDLAGADAINTSSLSCITDLVSDVNKNSNSTIQTYNKYPFVISTSKDIPIASKQNPIYQVSVDSENFTSFINEIQNTEIVGDVYSCLDLEDNLTVTEEDIVEITNQMPKVYVEVNTENNFTRLYLESDLNNGSATAVIDLGFSYPTNINVSEPVEYQDFKDFIQTLFMGM